MKTDKTDLADLMTMELHETIEFNCNSRDGKVKIRYAVTAVVGGWIYVNEAGKTTFVPYQKDNAI